MEPLYLMVALLLVELEKASRKLRTEQRWPRIELERMNDRARSLTEQPDSGRARGSSAPGRARPQPGRAPSSSAELGSAIRSSSFVFLLPFIFASDFQ